MVETRRPYYTIAEAAEKLTVSRSTVLRWIKSGRLRAYQLGPRTIRLHREEVDAMLEPVEPKPRPAVSTAPFITDIRELKPPTPEEVHQRELAMERMFATADQIAAAHPGVVYDAVEDIREQREERSRQLDAR